MGSSMVIKMKVENALRKLNQTDFTVNSCSVGEAKGLAAGYDIVIASLSFDSRIGRAKFKGKHWA